MEETLATIGVVGLALALFLGGAVTQDMSRDKKCQQGTPVVIEGKVYKCEPQK